MISLHDPSTRFLDDTGSFTDLRASFGRRHRDDWLSKTVLSELMTRNSLPLMERSVYDIWCIWNGQMHCVIKVKGQIVRLFKSMRCRTRTSRFLQILIVCNFAWAYPYRLPKRKKARSRVAFCGASLYIFQILCGIFWKTSPLFFNVHKKNVMHKKKDVVVKRWLHHVCLWITLMTYFQKWKCSM